MPLSVAPEQAAQAEGARSRTPTQETPISSNDHPTKGGGSDMKKIKNSPRISRFKISSLQLSAVARSSS
jgi:hypothetical protein